MQSILVFQLQTLILSVKDGDFGKWIHRLWSLIKYMIILFYYYYFLSFYLLKQISLLFNEKKEDKGMKEVSKKRQEIQPGM